jgi:hypothetical protein
MDMDQAAVFLAGSVLTTLGFVVVVIGIVVINNIISRYWKPVRIFTNDSWAAWGVGSARFVEPHELDKAKEPPLEKN